MKYAFAGDREISVKILKFMMKKGYSPSLLLVGDTDTTTHKEQLIKVSNLDESKIIYSSELNSKETKEKLDKVELDYIIGIHYPYIIKNHILEIPKVGVLNLHPAYLPYNKGWHTPSWAIHDNTPFGATLHFMSEKLDEGDIIEQEKIEISPDDTANSLYLKNLELEFKVFKNAWNQIISLNPKRIKQSNKGTSHSKKDLKTIAELNLNEKVSTKSLINKLRALTTNNVVESAYFIEDGLSLIHI